MSLRHAARVARTCMHMPAAYALAGTLASRKPAGVLAPLALAGMLMATPGIAQDEVTVFSDRADSVAVTIYPDDLALITETRTVSLPATAATLVIRDVADTLLPQSAVVNGLARPLAESNFDFNRLSPQSLLRQAIGQTVTLIRTNPATGTVSRTRAMLRAAGEGVVLESEDGNEALYCSGLPEGIAFDAIPDDLYATPQLSVRLGPGDAGERTLKLSYLAHGFEWSADYVARLDNANEQLDLIGWATVTNSSSKVFTDLELQLVAGQLNVLAGEAGGSRAERIPTARGESPIDARERQAEDREQLDALLLRECFAADPPSVEVSLNAPGPATALDAIVVTGARIQREAFGDYHLYRLPWRTELGARQTKQLRFLERTEVTVDRFYRLEISSFSRDNPRFFRGSLALYVSELEPSAISTAPPTTVVRTENTVQNGLGEPLPEGAIRFFEPYGDSAIFVGESYLTDRPVGAEIELEYARPVNVMVEADFRVSENGRWRLAADYRALNGKSLPIDLEIRHFMANETDFAVDETSRPYEVDNGYVVWRFVVPPGSAGLSYQLSMSER